jgi:mannose-6-phosphate isomerase-like protein (cupin superfamily)
MECVNRQQAVKHANSNHCTVYEYPMQNSVMNIGVVEITDRYPEQGYAMNHTCTEMGYVLKGTGRLVTETAEVELSIGDVVYISAGEKYYWEGNLTVIVPTTPAWYPEQHEILISYKKEAIK